MAWNHLDGSISRGAAGFDMAFMASLLANRNMPRLRTIRCGRIAPEASAGRNLAKTLVQIVLFWGFFLFVLPSTIFRLEEGFPLLVAYRFTSELWKTVGALLFSVMSLLGLTCAWTIVINGQGTPLPADCTRQLVVSGPYRYVRNPMAIAGFTQGAAVGLYLGSPLVLIYVAVGALGWNYFVRPWEEMDLTQRFGNQYIHYRNAVRCWIPHLRAYEYKNQV